MSRVWLALIAVCLAAGHVFAAGDTRFSQTLNAEERAATGLTRLTSDQVAVIDALVRRYSSTPGASAMSAATTSTEKEKEAAKPATFSERLTADERRLTGVTTLSAKELPQLNSLIDRYHAAKHARTFLAPLTTVPRRARSDPTEAKAERNRIHGSFSLSYGVGSGGYSEKTGSMMLNYDDPEGRYSVTIGYSESHIKGGHGVYRDPYYDRYYDPLYDLHRGPLLEPTRP